MSCLSHHEILQLCAPFASAGRRVDLGASDRLGGRLSFVPVVEGPDAQRWCETLMLERTAPAAYRLRRTVARADGMCATLDAAGTDPGELLARIRTVDPREQFDDRTGPDPLSIACSGHVRAARAESPSAFVASSAHARIGGRGSPMTLEAAWSGAGPMGFRLCVAPPHPAGRLALPADLFAVLGWRWSTLRQQGAGWSGSVRLPGHGRSARRAGEAARCIEQACRQVHETLAHPPEAFHRRWLGGRIDVLFRRSIPLLVWMLLIGQGLFARTLLLAGESPLRAALLAAPAVLLALFLWRSHEPRFELPAWPRPCRAQAWPPGLVITGAR